MAEDKTDSTNPLPFEEYVRQTLSVVVRQQAVMLDGQNELRLQQNLLQQQQSELQRQQNELRQEMAEHFAQISRQIKDLDVRLARLEEKVEDLEYRIDDFVKDVIQLKRERRNLQDRKTA